MLRLTHDLWSTANYLALNMLYARRYLAPGQTIEQSDVRDFAPGHWGCVPGLNFIWANLVTHAAATSTRFAPLVGTGHGGAAWVAWLLLNAADQAGELSTDELDDVIGGFGDDDRIPHELFGAMPGLLWPSGELGYALAVGQGASSELADRVTVILGDGELETGCTLSAIAAGPSLPRAPLVIVNANGFRMGGPSWFGQLSDYGRDLFSSLGWQHSVVGEGDARAFQAVLGNHDDKRPKVIVYSNAKGGDVPPLPGESAIVSAIHKLPKKQLIGEPARIWLRGWLDSFATPLLSSQGLRSRSGGRVSQSSSSLAQALQEGAHGTATSAPEDSASSGRGRSNDTCVEVFVSEVSRRNPNTLILSPDEASSNLVDSLGLEVREFLSEQLTFGWAIGAAAAGRTTLWVSYEAFAPLITTMIVQYARHLLLCPPDARPRRLPCIVLTSLSFRNVTSHQDVGFCADIERRRPGAIVFLVPHTLSFAQDAARIAVESAESARAIPIIVADKYSAGPDEWMTCKSTSARPDGWVVYAFGQTSDGIPRVALLALGAVQFHEAVRAARSIVALGISGACDVFVLWKVISGAKTTEILTDLLAGYAHVVAVAGLDSLTWSALLEDLRTSGRLIHNASFAPSAGTNDVARLFHCKLDWLAIVVSVGKALNKNETADLATTARECLRGEISQTRSAQWYHEMAWAALLERVGLTPH